MRLFPTRSELRAHQVLVAAILFYVATRLVLIGLDWAFLSDTKLYYEWAAQGVLEGKIAYRDFAYPYPTLSLPFVYLPAWLSDLPGGKWQYRNLFRLEMLCIDLLVVFLMVRLLVHRLGVTTSRAAGALALYTLGSLALGHLYYDRLDVVLALLLVALLSLFPASTGRSWAMAPVYLGIAAGVLFKVMPLFWLPIAAVADLARTRGLLLPAALRVAGRALLLGLLPCLLFGGLHDLAVDGALHDNMLDHGRRGIQVESSWALPIILGNMGSPELQVHYNYGAHHFPDELVPAAYLQLSKYAGFALLAVLYLLVLRRMLALRRAGTEGSMDELTQPFLLACMAVLTILVAFQRVLSPQYLIWMLPGLCIWWAYTRQSWAWLAGLATLYAVTGYGFRGAYDAYIEFAPHAVALIAVRNLMLCGLAVYFIAQLTRRATAPS